MGLTEAFYEFLLVYRPTIRSRGLMKIAADISAK